MMRSHLLKGFNLIESAIVLGIVGLVIGGIWIGASNVIFNMKVSQTKSDYLVLIQNARTLFQDGDYPTTDATYLFKQAIMVNAKAVPADLVVNGTLVNRFGFPIAINLGNDTFVYGGRFLAIDMILPRAACIQIVNWLLGLGKAQLMGIYTSDASTYVNYTNSTSVPANSTISTTACVSSTTQVSPVVAWK